MVSGRESGKEERAKSPAVAFDDRDDPYGDTGRKQQQGRGIDLGKRRQERGEEREGGERAAKSSGRGEAKSARPRSRSPPAR